MSKKFIILLIMLVCCILLTSCAPAPLPSSSENFSKKFTQSFENNYLMKDEDLRYVYASPMEAQTSSGIRLSLIRGTDKNLFVAGSILGEVGIYGDYTSNSFVYQHKDAPSPMKDWTIKEVRLLDSTYSWYYSSADETGNSVEAAMNSSDVIYTFYPDTDKELIDDIKNAYFSPTSQEEIYGDYYGSMVVCFEENENIVYWPNISCKMGIMTFGNDMHLSSESSQRILEIMDKYSDDRNPTYRYGELMHTTAPTDEELPITLIPWSQKASDGKPESQGISISAKDYASGREKVFASGTGSYCADQEGSGTFEVTKGSFNEFKVKWKTSDGYWYESIFNCDFSDAFPKNRVAEYKPSDIILDLPTVDFDLVFNVNYFPTDGKSNVDIFYGKDGKKTHWLTLYGKACEDTGFDGNFEIITKKECVSYTLRWRTLGGCFELELDTPFSYTSSPVKLTLDSGKEATLYLHDWKTPEATYIIICENDRCIQAFTVTSDFLLHNSGSTATNNKNGTYTLDLYGVLQTEHMSLSHRLKVTLPMPFIDK